jgi:hypothetical protein
MSFILFPGRHLLNTRFQEKYLEQILTEAPGPMPGLLPGLGMPNGPIH